MAHRAPRATRVQTSAYTTVATASLDLVQVDVFAISTTTIAARLGRTPRWLTALGLATGVVLLVSAGLIPWVELIFPAWVFVFSVHILVATFRGSESDEE